MLPRIPLGTARSRDELPSQVMCPTSPLRARPRPADPESHLWTAYGDGPSRSLPPRSRAPGQMGGPVLQRPPPRQQVTPVILRARDVLYGVRKLGQTRTVLAAHASRCPAPLYWPRSRTAGAPCQHHLPHTITGHHTSQNPNVRSHIPVILIKIFRAHQLRSQCRMSSDT